MMRVCLLTTHIVELCADLEVPQRNIWQKIVIKLRNVSAWLPASESVKKGIQFGGLLKIKPKTQAKWPLAGDVNSLAYEYDNRGNAPAKTLLNIPS